MRYTTIFLHMYDKKKGDFFLAKQRNEQIQQAIQPSTHTKRPHYSIKLLYESMK